MISAWVMHTVIRIQIKKKAPTPLQDRGRSLRPKTADHDKGTNGRGVRRDIDLTAI